MKKSTWINCLLTISAVFFLSWLCKGAENTFTIEITAPIFQTDPQETHAIIEEYLKRFERATNEEIPRRGLNFKIIEEPIILMYSDGPGGVTITAAVALFYGDKENRSERNIILTYYRDNGNRPRLANPFPWIFHELTHDWQYRHGQEVNHDWTDRQRDIIDAGLLMEGPIWRLKLGSTIPDPPQGPILKYSRGLLRK